MEVDELLGEREEIHPRRAEMSLRTVGLRIRCWLLHCGVVWICVSEAHLDA